ncbi:MAG: hypothetical protein H0U66_06260, partial [Gemmatimonadaceae bacterium]|nr:hypothetical protein [Gemmatimonadaceae bacterium]
MTTVSFDLDAIDLKSGGHNSFVDGVCAMELVSYLAGEEFSDHPKCTSPVIGAFVRSWNDSLADEPRNRLLRPLLPKLIGTRTTEADDETRAWMATDWLVRVHTPAWLELAGFFSRAAELRALPVLTSSEIAVACQSVLAVARSDATAAGDAAWAAAG